MQPGEEIPGLFFTRTDGTGVSLSDFRGERRVLLVMADRWLDTVLAFAGHFQADARQFAKGNLKLLVAYKDHESVPTPWPAPDFPPAIAPREVPEALEWGKAYLAGEDGLVREVYKDLDLLAVGQVERDLAAWRAKA